MASKAFKAGQTVAIEFRDCGLERLPDLFRLFAQWRRSRQKAEYFAGYYAEQPRTHGPKTEPVESRVARYRKTQNPTWLQRMVLEAHARG